jgi:hypothetical protein
LSIKLTPLALSCVLASLLAVACGDGGGVTASAPASGVPGQLASALSPNASARASATALALVPRALKEVVARVPSALPRTSESGTLVGRDASASPLSSAAPAPAPTGDQSLIDLRPDLKASNAGSEKDLRASLYFDLVDQCRDAAGKHLPAEAVEVEFRIDPRGRIDRTSVKAKAAHPEHAAAAECMMRVVRTADARFSTPRLDEPTRIRAKVPSVD